MLDDRKRLVLPQYSWDEEQALIRQAWKSAQEGSHGVQVVFVEGDAGTGKSTLMRDTLQNMSSRSCLHATTKLDQAKQQQAPLEGLRLLYSNLFDSAMQMAGASELIAKELQAELPERQLRALLSFASTTLSLSDVTDSCNNINNNDDGGDDNNNTGLSESSETGISKDSLAVLTASLKASMRAISNVATVVLVVEDIHWGCALTRQLLKSVLTDPHLKNVLFFGTLRISEETAVEGFYEWKEKLEKEATIQDKTIRLQNLKLEQIEELLAHAMNQEIDQVEELARLVHGFTHGNLFFIHHLLEKFQDDNLLTFNMLLFRWEWNETSIRKQASITNNVLTVLSSRIHKLSKSVRDVLALASCFGAQFDKRALSAVRSVLNVDAVEEALEEAHRQEFVIQLGKTQYRFAHDFIQLTAYGLLPEYMELQSVHWTIGRILLDEKDLLKIDSIFFACVDNLNMADHESMNIDDKNLQEKLAKANHKAALKAISLSAFLPAIRYVEAGLAYLGGDPFKSHYNLAIEMYRLMASANYAAGKVDVSEVAAQTVINNVETLDEKLPSLLVILDCLHAKYDPDKLVQVGLNMLNSLGVHVARKPNQIQAQRDLQKMKAKLKKMSDDDILAIPLLEDPKKEAILQILDRLAMPIYQLEETRLYSLIVCHMVQVTLKHGISLRVSPYAFLLAGALIVAENGDIKEGYRLGNVAEKLERRTLQEGKHIITKASSFVAIMTKWWLEPLPNGLDLYVSTYQHAMKEGDCTLAFQSSVAYCVQYFYAGLPLGPLLKDVEKFCGQYLEYNQEFFFFCGSAVWQCLLNLMNKSENPASLEVGEIIDKRKAIDSSSKVGEGSIQAFQMMLSFYLGDLPKATEMAEEVSKAKLGMMASTCWAYSREFFFALIAIANYRLTKRRKDKVEAEKLIKRFHGFVRQGAINLVHKVQLLEAEMLSLKAMQSSSMQHSDAVIAKYNQAITSSARTGFLQDSALANYLCFQFMQSSKTRLHLSDLYLKRAYENWLEWGAEAVALSLLDRHADIVENSGTFNEILLANQSFENHRHEVQSGRREIFDASLTQQELDGLCKNLSKSLPIEDTSFTDNVRLTSITGKNPMNS